MSDSLATYLQDHLAGSAHATELVEHISDQHAGESLGDFAAQLLVEIKADQQILQELTNGIGAGSSTLKEAAGWVAEKVTRLKLGREEGNNLATFQALEFLGLDVGELGCEMADTAGQVRARAPRHERRKADCGVPLSQRGLVVMDRVSAHARALAGIVVQVDSVLPVHGRCRIDESREAKTEVLAGTEEKLTECRRSKEMTT